MSELPEAFCWSKFGSESGEDVTSILARKDIERELNDGLFLWGIGNSIRPSVAALVEKVATPEVVFTPMLSRAAAKDSAPSQVLVWSDAVGIDGVPYEMPPHSVVTSRGSLMGRRRASHYALVCECDSSLSGDNVDAWLDSSDVRNLLTGNEIGSSQVTSVVVRRGDGRPGSRQYRIAFRAKLVAPFVVTLRSPSFIPEELRLDGYGSDVGPAFENLRSFVRNAGLIQVPGWQQQCIF